ncbi:MAG TPA: TIGR03790 family protein [Bryobacteraceae bacterium]|nr:TIGR03790 family protein [Bryobacteraceae bacterium]
MRFALILLPSALAVCQSAANVLVVANEASPLSQKIADYYAARRHIPPANICRLNVQPDEEISPEEYQSRIADPIAAFLRAHHLEENILYIVTTAGLPLRVSGHGDGILSEVGAVDSELALLYSDMHAHPHIAPSGIPNPFFGRINASFRHPDFPIYLVTRLAGYDFADVKALIDRSLEARNRGLFVIDLRASDNTGGNKWLTQAAAQLPRQRVVLDLSSKVLYQQVDVIGYASWGSNDPDRKERHLDFHWLPGAIMTEYVSTNARTFARPPENWNFSSTANGFFGGSSQSLTADYIHDGVTGASGHVAEPFLQFTPRPDILLPAYYHGRNLAESYYLSIRALSWMNVVIGDPLCTLGKPN